jgi:hypothetical protein
MTPVRGIKIDLNEFEALEITCKRCSSVIRLAGEVMNLPAHLVCAGCNTSLWLHEHDMARTVALGCLRSIKHYRDRSKDETFAFGLGFTLESSSRDPDAS